MRPSAVLVHLSRGGIVDETALCAALREGRLAGAALDVFEHEPLPPDSPLWTTPRLIITPHVAGRVRGYVERALRLFVQNLEQTERGDAPKTRVDRNRGY
jgi:phosphoglycerate dehydrogenase-like enzyme